MPYPSQLSPWQAWSMEVQQLLRAMQQEIDSLKTRVDALEEQLANESSSPTYHIERLEYHFDQLKVQKLEGTLNIGMTPPADGSSGEGVIEQFATSPVNMFPAAESTIMVPGAPFPEITANVDAYFNQEAPARLIAMEQEMGLQLDPYHRRIIIEDVRKQVPTRIRYYVNRFNEISQQNNKIADSNVMIADVTTKTIKDAEAAMRQYLQQIANNAANQNGCNPANAQGTNGMNGGKLKDDSF